MKVKAINLYTYKEPFKCNFNTESEVNASRKFYGKVTYSGETYYGECNAF